MGELPHIINPNKYNYDNFDRIYTKLDNILDEWTFGCDFIYNFKKDKNYSDTNVTDYIYKKKAKIVFDLNLNGIILDMGYFQIFNITFFYEYFKNKICQTKKKEYLTYIYCEKEKVNIKKFKNIYFYQNNFNYTFYLDYNDLFFVYNSTLFFNIFFDENGFSHLLNIGKIFLKKYLLVFNYDNKMIGFYKNKEEIGLIIEEKKELFSKVFKIVAIVILILIILGLIIILIKCLYKKNGRKPRKNELDEEFDYSIQNNEEN